VDVLSEEDFIGMKGDETYSPSSFSVRKAEPKVSHVVTYFCGGFCVWCVHVVFLLVGGDSQYNVFII
jgi:hypothetical protein